MWLRQCILKSLYDWRERTDDHRIVGLDTGRDL